MEKKLFPTNRCLTISEDSSWKLLEVLKHLNLSSFADDYMRNDKYSWFSTLKENFLCPPPYLSHKNSIYLTHGIGQYLLALHCKKYLNCIINIQKYWTLSFDSKWSSLKTIINTKTRYFNYVVLKYARSYTYTIPKDLIEALGLVLSKF